MEYSRYNFSNKGIGAGTYQATITNEQNCSENIQITITEPLKFVLSLSSGTNYNNYDISCFGRKDGEIQISATGQQGNLEYFLNNNKVNIPLQKLGAGQHIIKLKMKKIASLKTRYCCKNLKHFP